jgi:hypothetical protein
MHGATPKLPLTLLALAMLAAGSWVQLALAGGIRLERLGLTKKNRPNASC